jgi:peptide deformylase
MNRLPRTYFGNPILRMKAKRVASQKIGTPAFEHLIQAMFFTMRRVGGVGLAAPQIGKSIQLAVIEIEPTSLRPRIGAMGPTVIINPVIVSHSKKRVYDWEGCLSFTDARGLVPRYAEIVVTYLDRAGEKRKVRLKGFQARVFQHEIDHLNGAVYVDRMTDMKSLMTVAEFRKRVLREGPLRSR